MFGQNELVQQLKELIVLNGFEIIQKEDGVCWEKMDNDRKLSLFIGFSGYPDRYSLQYPIATISFKSVDDIISNLNIPQRFITNNYTCRFVYNENINSFEISDIPITSKIDCEKVVRLILPMIEEIITFFNMHKELKDVITTINDLVMKKAVYFLGQPFSLRKMAILYFTNLNDYKDFSEKIILSFKKLNNPLLESVLELKKILETTPPSYSLL